MEITINPPNPANKITLTPPSGGNPITIYAGIAGPTGPIGPVGPATTLSVGGTTTGSPGSSASVSLSGNAPSQTMYFTIPSGVKGDTGATGPSNTLSVGGTTTGIPGSSAIVSLSGSSPNQYLYTTIPAGIQGSTGATGASPTLSVNSLVGSVAYGQQAKASLSGTATNPVLNLTLQSGQTGATGATGSTGATPTLSVNSLVGSVPSGTQGSASISGTATNPVLSLTLPSGQTGATGSTGATGATGAGYDGVTSSSSILIPSNPSPSLQSQRTLTVNKTGAFAVGSRIILSATINPQVDWMGGTISAISGNNWTVYIDVKGSNSNGTYSSWTVSALGATGTNGTNGSNGSSPTLSVNSTIGTVDYGNNGVASLDNTNVLDPVLYLTLPSGPQGPASPYLQNGSAYLSLDSAGNVTFPFNSANVDYQGNATLTTASIGGGGFYVDNGGNASIGSGAIALHTDGSASFAGGATQITSEGGLILGDTIRSSYNANFGSVTTATLTSADGNAACIVGGGIVAGIQGLAIQDYQYDLCDFGLNTSTGRTYSFRLENRGSSYSNNGEIQIADINGGTSTSRMIIGDAAIVIGGNGEQVLLSGSNIISDALGNFTCSSTILKPSGAPDSPSAGQIYFDSGDSHFYGYNGSGWVQLDN